MKARIIYFFTLVLLFPGLGFSQDIRTIDGVQNNSSNPEWGAEGTELFQLTAPRFSDGISTVNGADRPNPRAISNRLFAQVDNIFDDKRLSDYVWVFGQFIDHEIILVENNHEEPLSISIPADDEVFIPGGVPIFMFRSVAFDGSGTSSDNVRTYRNDLTAYIDASTVYGSTESREHWLRSFIDGKLKVSEGNLLPWNTLTGEFNDPTDSDAPFMDDAVGVGPKHFIAGDVRANENPLLATIHTLFVREHNRLATEIAAEHPDFDDEEIYQDARRRVGAYLQSIVYNEWLPAMGVNLAPYAGYREEVNAQISNVFSAAAFRMGHTLINSNIMRLDEEGAVLASGDITLRDAFFNPIVIPLAGGIDPYIRGMAAQVQQELDCKVIDDVRNFLFGLPGQGGLDLAAININRGRERGLGDYNSIREDIGLPRLQSLSELTSNAEDIAVLQDLYGSVDQIDAWVGMLAEDHMPEAMFGNTIMAIMEDQFQRLRDGDRFFYLNDEAFSDEEKLEITNTSFRDLIMRNTGIDVMQDNVFTAVDPQDLIDGPDIEQIDLNAVIYPNPSLDNAFVKVYAEQNSDIELSMFDAQGKLLSKTSITLGEGDNIIDLDVQDLGQSGVYHVILTRGDQQSALRLFRP